jgi:two-component system, chemotaxis family, chemotaxis protein CheY
MKILITDDSAFMRAIVKSSLAEFSPEVIEAENGDVAVELYKLHHPDMVFLDIIMPVKNGIMAMEEIKGINPEAKIVIVTSVGQEEMVTKAKELGATEFVPKPFKPDDLKAIYRKYFS